MEEVYKRKFKEVKIINFSISDLEKVISKLKNMSRKDLISIYRKSGYTDLKLLGNPKLESIYFLWTGGGIVVRYSCKFDDDDITGEDSIGDYYVTWDGNKFEGDF